MSVAIPYEDYAMQMAIHLLLEIRLVAMVLAAAKLVEHHLLEVGNYFGSQSPGRYQNSQKETDTSYTRCSPRKQYRGGEVVQRTTSQDVFYVENASNCLPCLFAHKGVINYGGCSPQFPNNPILSSDR
jgi:hypothetical protein